MYGEALGMIETKGLVAMIEGPRRQSGLASWWRCTWFPGPMRAWRTFYR